MYVKNVEELNIYQISFQLSKDIEKLVKSIPNYWRDADIKQILRSSGSVPSNIAEGFSHRFYPKQFIRYLNVSHGSSEETKKHLKKLVSKKLISDDNFSIYLKGYKDLSVRIVNFISYLRKKHNLPK